MSTRQIPQDQWNDYLSGFSAHNQTRHIAIDLESTELGPQRLVDQKPLLGVEPDLKDEHHPAITVIVGDPEGGEPDVLRHQVENPTAIWVKQGEDGEVEALDIETEDGRAILEFV